MQRSRTPHPALRATCARERQKVVELPPLRLAGEGWGEGLRARSSRMRCLTSSSSAAAITALSPPPISPPPGSKSPCSSGARQVGGAAATEEFHPGFRNSVAAYAVSLLSPTIIRDLDLHRHGLKLVERPLSNFLPLPDGRYLKVAPGRTKAEVAKFSARDAERLDAYEARLERLTDVLRALALETPAQSRDRTGPRRRPREPPRNRQGRKPPAFARARRAARSSRALHPLGRRCPRPMVRERSDQGDPRLRRDRRNLCQPLCRGNRLRAHASLLGRGERQAGRLGPRDRRHGRDHPSDGARLRRARGRNPHWAARSAQFWSRRAAPPASSRARARGSRPARWSRTSIRS